MPTLTLTGPPKGVDVIEVGIVIDGVEHGRTKDGDLVALEVKVIEVTEAEAKKLARQLGK